MYFRRQKVLGLQRVVWASSIQAIGVPYEHPTVTSDISLLTRVSSVSSFQLFALEDCW